jgi:hypothetical protein
LKGKDEKKNIPSFALFSFKEGNNAAENHERKRKQKKKLNNII